jgi:hypothetical protein
LIEEQYENPVHIVAFNTAEGWSHDMTVDIADELRLRCVECSDVPYGRGWSRDVTVEIADELRRALR